MSFKLQNVLPRVVTLLSQWAVYGITWQLISIPALAGVFCMVLSYLFYEYAVIKCAFLCPAVAYSFVRLCGSLNTMFDPGAESL